MSKTLDDLIERAQSLTIEEQLRLAAYLVQRVVEVSPLLLPQPLKIAKRRRKWREIRGLARPSLLGEDAQAWISRTRREADGHRARQWGNPP